MPEESVPVLIFEALKSVISEPLPLNDDAAICPVVGLIVTKLEYSNVVISCSPVDKATGIVPLYVEFLTLTAL